MPPIAPGAPAPPIPGVELGEPTAVLFYKVTCPVCQLAAPVAQNFERAYPGRIVGVGQDPPPKLDRFSTEFGMSFPSIADEPPYPASVAYGIQVVPTVALVDRDGTVADLVESWDRDGFNRVSRHLAELTGSEFAPVSREGDGLPPFRPG